jgi:hypothetical protein
MPLLTDDIEEFTLAHFDLSFLDAVPDRDLRRRAGLCGTSIVTMWPMLAIGMCVKFRRAAGPCVGKCMGPLVRGGHSEVTRLKTL